MARKDEKKPASENDFLFALDKVSRVTDVPDTELDLPDESPKEERIVDKLVAPTTTPVLPSKKRGVKGKEEEVAPSPKGDRFHLFGASLPASEIVKKYGRLALCPASELDKVKPPVLPFNIFSVDYAVGGGMPWGHILMVYGPEHAGKTTLCVKLLVQAQRTCVTCYGQLNNGKCPCGANNLAVCLYVDTEGTFSMDWARLLGVDLTRLYLSQPETGEEAVDIVEAAIREGSIDFIVLDSIGFMVTEKETEIEAGGSVMGKTPQMLSQAAKKFRAAFASRRKQEHYPILAMTNHIYYAVGLVFGNPERVQGGQKMKYIATMTIRVEGKVEEDKDTADALHTVIKFKVAKNKWAMRARQGEFTLLLARVANHKVGESFDSPYIREQAEHHGLLSKGKENKYWLLDRGFSTHKSLEEALATDNDYKHRVIDAVIQEGAKIHT